VPVATTTGLRALAQRDRALGAVMKRLGPLPAFPQPAQRRMSTFAYLARSIVYQQLAGKAAATIFGRVCALTRGCDFPTPQALLSLSDDTLRGAGLSRAKLAALRDLSERVLDGRLKTRGLSRLGNDEIIERLVAVRGIGPWTAQMFLIFKLGRLDVLPIADLGVQEGARILDGLSKRPTPKELAARGAAWAPLSSVAAWYMWRLADEAKESLA